MFQIGAFSRTSSGFHGHLRTLLYDIDLCLIPIDPGAATNAPDYRLHRGTDEDGPEVGAGWNRTGERAGPYVSLSIDDPTLARAINAKLYQSSLDGNVHRLMWDRPKPRKPKS